MPRFFILPLLGIGTALCLITHPVMNHTIPWQHGSTVTVTENLQSLLVACKGHYPQSDVGVPRHEPTCNPDGSITINVQGPQVVDLNFLPVHGVAPADMPAATPYSAGYAKIILAYRGGPTVGNPVQDDPTEQDVPSMPEISVYATHTQYFTVKLVCKGYYQGSAYCHHGGEVIAQWHVWLRVFPKHS